MAAGAQKLYGILNHRDYILVTNSRFPTVEKLKNKKRLREAKIRQSDLIANTGKRLLPYE